MKLTPINAPEAPQPVGGSYAQAVEVTGASRLLFISGQIPATAEGAAVPADFESQARLCWKNIEAQLRAANMTLDNLVQVRVFLADRTHIPAYRNVRNEVLQGRQVSLTTIITGIFDEAWLLEIEAVAAA